MRGPEVDGESSPDVEGPSLAAKNSLALALASASCCRWRCSAAAAALEPDCPEPPVLLLLSPYVMSTCSRLASF